MKKRFLFPLTLLFTIVLTTASAQDWQQVRSSDRNGYVVDMAIRNNRNAEYLYGVQRKDSGNSIQNQWVIRTPLEGGNGIATRLDISDAVTSIAVRPDGNEVVVGKLRSQVDDWDQNLNYQGRYDSPGTEYPLSLAYSRDGSWLAAGTDEDVILIWRTSNRAYTRTLRGHTGSVRAVAWSPTTNNVFASGSDDGTVRLWNPNNGINYAILRGHTSKINAVAFSANGQILASTSYNDTKIILWNVKTGSEIRRISMSWVDELAWHPDGQTLFAAQPGIIRLFNPNNGTQKQALFHPSKPNPGGGSTSPHISGIAPHPNGLILATAGTFGKLFFWEPSDRLDVTGNGKVNINDLVEVARNYGKTVAGGANAKADVNNDGRVDITDITLVARRINASFAAPSTGQQLLNLSLTAAEVQQWIQDAKSEGIDAEGLRVLEQLLAALQQQLTSEPENTALLANYPNPFNPETWIPYQLATPAEVTVSIHASDGKLVRTLALGQLPTGIYQDKDRAAYWDGKNEQGESVASGVYFYTLKAGDFSATKKMLIRK